MNFDPEEIVEFILKRFNDGDKETAIIENLDETFDMDSKTAKHAVEMTQAGFVRAGKIHSGEEFPQSKNDRDPFFRVAVKLGIEEFDKRGEK